MSEGPSPRGAADGPGRAGAIAAVALAALLAACGREAPPAPSAASRRPAASASVEFTQVLIGYRVEGLTPFQRTRAEALDLAERAIARARAGEPMERLALELTDDRDDQGEPFNRGSYTITKRDPRVMKVVMDAILDTPVGEVHPQPVDTGRAFVVFRRDR